MNERLAAELELLRSVYPDAELRDDDLWARIPRYSISESIWGLSEIEVAFRFVLPGQPPYGFWVRPGLSLAGATAIQSYQHPVVNPFGEGWGQFSWAPDDWATKHGLQFGGTMLRWAQSFADRLSEGA